MIVAQSVCTRFSCTGCRSSLFSRTSLTSLSVVARDQACPVKVPAVTSFHVRVASLHKPKVGGFCDTWRGCSVCPLTTFHQLACATFTYCMSRSQEIMSLLPHLANGRAVSCKVTRLGQLAACPSLQSPHTGCSPGHIIYCAGAHEAAVCRPHMVRRMYVHACLFCTACHAATALQHLNQAAVHIRHPDTLDAPAQSIKTSNRVSTSFVISTSISATPSNTTGHAMSCKAEAPSGNGSKTKLKLATELIMRF